MTNLLEIDLSVFEDEHITVFDIKKCINYNNGKEVAFAENDDYYGVPKRLIPFIKPYMMSHHTKFVAKELRIESVWELSNEDDAYSYVIKPKFLRKDIA